MAEETAHGHSREVHADEERRYRRSACRSTQESLPICLWLHLILSAQNVSLGKGYRVQSDVDKPAAATVLAGAHATPAVGSADPVTAETPGRKSFYDCKSRTVQDQESLADIRGELQHCKRCMYTMHDFDRPRQPEGISRPSPSADAFREQIGCARRTLHQP
jgi:hypothetical protein